MMDDKGLEHASTSVHISSSAMEKEGTQSDRRHMDRMGKIQQLKRNFKFMSIFGYAVILGNTWEFSLVIIGISLSNGGTAGAIWMFLGVCFGMFFVMLSMAELASMAPTAGGQYHWVSEIAPRKQQRFLSYIVGWLCVIGWQAAMATTALAATQQVQGLIALNLPSYTIQRWQTTLFCIAITCFAILWNTIFVKTLPLLESIGLVLHVLGFITFVVVLWVTGPSSDSHTVWTRFEDNSGWGDTGVATLVGILGPILTLIGSDSSCHLSEEVQDSARVVPRAMVATAIVNYALGFVMTVTVMSRLGNDVPTLLKTPFGQPWIQVLYNATESRLATSILTAVLWLLLLFCNINEATTSSRQLFAFARDKGLLFSDFLAYVPPNQNVPVNAIGVTLLITTLLSLIIIGSDIAFNVITSLGQVGLLSSYLIVIGCIFAKRVCGERLLSSQFSLGRAGIVVNAIAIAFLSVAFVFCFFPSAPNPTPAGMNWSSLMFGFILLFSLVYYYAFGRRYYVGPVEYVKD